MRVTRRRRACRRVSPRRTSSWRSSARSAPRAAPATSSNMPARRSARLSMEGRMTICNMSIEGGARAGMVAPDATTFAYVKDRPKAPKGAAFDAARRYWESLVTDDGRAFRPRGAPRRRQPAAAGELGHQPRGRDLDPGPRAGSGGDRRREQAAVEGEGARLYGPDAGHPDHRHHPGSDLHRILHQRPHRGSARGCAGRRRPQGA